MSATTLGLQPAAVLLPITGILLVTSEWSQRSRATGLNGFYCSSLWVSGGFPSPRRR